MNHTASNTLTVTLVDDDPSVRSAVSRLLRSYNYSCKAYESAESALTDPDFASVDCVVVDIQLSGMSGFALRDRLLRDGVRTPCLFITAHAETNSPDWMRSIGNNRCIVKPFDESQLLEAIHEAVEKQGSHPSR